MIPAAIDFIVGRWAASLGGIPIKESGEDAAWSGFWFREWKPIIDAKKMRLEDESLSRFCLVCRLMEALPIAA